MGRERYGCLAHPVASSRSLNGRTLTATLMLSTEVSEPALLSSVSLKYSALGVGATARTAGAEGSLWGARLSSAAGLGPAVGPAGVPTAGAASGQRFACIVVRDARLAAILVGEDVDGVVVLAGRRDLAGPAVALGVRPGMRD